MSELLDLKEAHSKKGRTPRFFFDIVVNGDRSPDPHGILLENAEEAYRLGLYDAGVLGGPSDGYSDSAHCVLEILDEQRTLLFKVPFLLDEIKLL